MVCPVCQQESGSAAVCAKCGGSLVPTQAASTGEAFASGKPASASENVKSALTGIVVVILWTVVALLSYLRALRWSRGNMNAEAFGYLIGSSLAPILIAALIVWLMNRSRQVKMSHARKQTLLASFALGIALVSFAGERRPLTEEESRKKVGHLLKQAAGKEAVSDAEWYSAPSRDFFRDILKYNQEYQGAVHAIDGSSMKKLYTPESYATRESLQQTVEKLQEFVDVDKKYEPLDPIFKRLQTNIAAAAPTKTQSDEFLQGFNSTAQKALGPRNETFRTEEEWLQSSIDLYQFALAHFGDYKVRAKKLIFTHDDIREQFQSLQSKSVALHKSAMEAKKVLDASRQEAFAKTGVTPEEISPQPPQKK